MQYGAIALAASGLAIGLLFQVKFLLPVVGLVLVISLFFALAHHLNFFDTAMTIFAAQAILQGSYFIGVILRSIFSTSRGSGHVF